MSLGRQVIHPKDSAARKSRSQGSEGCMAGSETPQRGSELVGEGAVFLATDG
jgi:hypothetical protein